METRKAKVYIMRIPTGVQSISFAFGDVGEGDIGEGETLPSNIIIIINNNNRGSYNFNLK